MVLKNLFSPLGHGLRTNRPNLDEEGTMISRRLREFLDLTRMDEVEKPSTETRREQALGSRPHNR